MLSNKKKQVYMNVAKEISKLSHDPDTKVGAVLVSPQGSIIATGYNGFLRDAYDDILPTERPLKYEYIQHAERNILYNCLAEGISTKDCTIITTLSPCAECLRAIYQAKVKKVIFKDFYSKIGNVEYYTSLPDIFVTFSLNEFCELELWPANEMPKETMRSRVLQ